MIVIDQGNGLVFSTEDELYKHFLKEIEVLEDQYLDLRSATDIKDTDFEDFQKNLGPLLEDPDEIWIDEDTIEGVSLAIYLREFEDKNGRDLFHVAITYLTDSTPSFVYLHFPTHSLDLVGKYQRGEIIYDRVLKNAPLGAIEGDALLEGDELAIGLYDAMLTLRTDADFGETEFRNFSELREQSIEEADEIWRTNDSMGNVLVNFVREHHDVEGYGDLWYIVVTVEDTPSNSHALLFSFPTKDKSLVERYRHGENLQADEVVQEASH